MGIVKDAQRWKAFLNSGRIRILGSGGLGGDHQHFGAEFWDVFPDRYDNEAAKVLLTTYVDTIRSRQGKGEKVSLDKLRRELLLISQSFDEEVQMKLEAYGDLYYKVSSLRTKIDIVARKLGELDGR